jgi:hypothetical protein
MNERAAGYRAFLDVAWDAAGMKDTRRFQIESQKAHGRWHLAPYSGRAGAKQPRRRGSRASYLPTSNQTQWNARGEH